MTVKGRIKDGRFVSDDRIELPEGTILDVDVALPEVTPLDTETNGAVHAAASKRVPPMSERFAKFIGIVEGPRDWARNLDHYLYGAPRE